MALIPARKLLRVYERQVPMRSGSRYEPAIQVRRGEVPAASRPSLLWSAKLGRHLHCLSQNEQLVAIALLYLKCVYDIHEQSMLPTDGDIHPLANEYISCGLLVPRTEGTLAIAAAMGCQQQHPMSRVDGDLVPYPYLTDFLAFVRDDLGPFCVDISVKGYEQDFKEAYNPAFRVGKKFSAASMRAQNRHRIQQILNDQLGIRTTFVAARQVNKSLAYNLTHAFKYHAQRIDVSEDARAYVVEELRACMMSGDSPLSIHGRIAKEAHIDLGDFRAIFFQAIWDQQLKADLCSCIQIDRPLTPAKTNHIDEIAEWVRR